LTCLLVLVIVALVGVLARHNSLDGAKVGSCVRGQSGDDLKVVDCAQSHDWTVIGRMEGRTEAQFNADADLAICHSAAGTQAQFWRGGRGQTGYVLCLGPGKAGVGPAH
jgi:hypothetical protein